MSHLSQFKKILEGQRRKGIKSGDWKELKYTTTRDDDGITLHIDSVEIGFKFSRRGQLVGIFNWKD